GHMPSFALNFSRPSAQVLLQYYLFLRLGFDGYYRVQKASQDVAVYLASEIGRMPAFELWNDGTDIPVFAWQLRKGHTDKWNLYHLSERLRLKGWLIPAYPMPDDLTDVVVQRIVVRNGLSRNLAESLVIDIAEAAAYLDALEAPMPTEGQVSAFTH
ncbi:MAG TPA: pyridoxal-dependent decarboxylase, partial [Diaminobutyricibacter sp.]